MAKVNSSQLGADVYYAGGTDVPVADGGTGSSTASGARTNLGVAIGSDVQAHSAVLDATTASFLTADETKLDGIETGADVTDTANVTAAGALMDSEVDADIKTLSLPASTTISTFGASLIDDASASAARTTLGVDAAGTDNAPAASTSTAGKVELATAAETTTGTATTLAVTPDGLSGSVFGEKSFSPPVKTGASSDDDTAVGNGVQGFTVPASMDGMDIVDVVASVHTAGTTGTTDFQIRRRRGATDVDVLSTKVTIDSTENSSTDATTAFVINTSNDDLNEGDMIYVDLDAVSTTAAKGATVTITARTP